MDKTNTLCNKFRYLSCLIESLCNNSRISEVIGFIFWSRLYFLSKLDLPKSNSNQQKQGVSIHERGYIDT